MQREVKTVTNQNFLSELEDAKPATAGGVRAAFNAVLIGLSAVTSAAFFYTYAPHTFDFISPALSPLLAALTGVVCYELASVAWGYLGAHDADTNAQLATAKIGAWGCMFGGLVVTAVYFTLNTELISARLDDNSIVAFSLLGGALIVLGIGGNFALGFIYRANSAAHVAASNAAEIRAAKTFARHTIARETTNATLAQTVDQIRRGLPQHAARQGALNAGEFIEHNFSPYAAPEGGQEGLERPLAGVNGSRPTQGR